MESGTSGLTGTSTKAATEGGDIKLISMPGVSGSGTLMLRARTKYV